MTLVVQRLIGAAAIADPARGKMYPIGPGFEMPEHKRHRETYSFVQAQEVADWLNGNDRPLAIVSRAVDPFDPVNRQGMRDDGFGEYRCDIKGAVRKGLTPIRD